MSKINFDEWFLSNQERRKVNIGIELELLLFDTKRKEPLRDMDVCEAVLHSIRKNTKSPNVYRDYYPYQLEIRSTPSNSASDIIEEVLTLYKEAQKEFMKYNVLIIPAPGIVKNNYRHCGFHIHMSSDEVEDNSYFEMAMGMYPFILSLADHTKNFETDTIHTSDRLSKSPHIGKPRLDKRAFLEGNRNESKYRDIILSLSNGGDNHSRLKKPATIEARMFDTPSLVKHFDFIVRFCIELASRIRLDNPMVSMLKENIDGTSKLVDMSRELLINQRYGVNKIFRMLNSDVCETASDFFGIEFPRQTQFEYREEHNLSANVNGFLSMATKGGWL
jgi:hypothetical protein